MRDYLSIFLCMILVLTSSPLAWSKGQTSVSVNLNQTQPVSFKEVRDHQVELSYDLIQKGLSLAIQEVSQEFYKNSPYRVGEYPFGTITGPNEKVVELAKLNINFPFKNLLGIKVGDLNVEELIRVTSDRQQFAPNHSTGFFRDLGTSQFSLQNTAYPGSSNFLENAWMGFSPATNRSLNVRTCSFLPGINLTTDPLQKSITTDRDFTWYKIDWEDGIVKVGQMSVVICRRCVPKPVSVTEKTRFDINISSSSAKFRHLKVCFLTNISASTVSGQILAVKILDYYLDIAGAGAATPFIDIKTNNPYLSIVLPVANALFNLTSGFATIFSMVASWVGENTGLSSALLTQKTFPYVKPAYEKYETKINAALGKVINDYQTQASSIRGRIDNFCEEIKAFDPSQIGIGNIDVNLLIDLLKRFNVNIDSAKLRGQVSVVKDVVMVGGVAVRPQGNLQRWLIAPDGVYDPNVIVSKLLELYNFLKRDYRTIVTRLCTFDPPQLAGFSPSPAQKITCDQANFRLHPTKFGNENEWWKRYSAYRLSERGGCFLSLNVRIGADRCFTPAIDCAKQNINNLINGARDPNIACRSLVVDGVFNVLNGNSCLPSNTNSSL